LNDKAGQRQDCSESISQGPMTLPMAARMSCELAGRTRRATSCPCAINTSVGHSLTRNERPRARPRAVLDPDMPQLGVAGQDAGKQGLRRDTVATPGCPELDEQVARHRVDLRPRGFGSGVEVIHHVFLNIEVLTEAPPSPETPLVHPVNRHRAGRCQPGQRPTCVVLSPEGSAARLQAARSRGTRSPGRVPEQGRRGCGHRRSGLP
jgi:hypothetical protein